MLCQHNFEPPISFSTAAHETGAVAPNLAEHQYCIATADHGHTWRNCCAVKLGGVARRILVSLAPGRLGVVGAWTRPCSHFDSTPTAIAQPRQTQLQCPQQYLLSGLREAKPFQSEAHTGGGCEVMNYGKQKSDGHIEVHLSSIQVMVTSFIR